MLPAKVLHQLRGDAVGCLWRNRGAVMNAMLGAQLDIEQAQKVPHLGGGAHRGFAPAAAQALLDGHGGWYAVHRVDFGATGGLHNRACIGIQAFQVTALPLVEQNIKRKGGLARA